MNYKQKIERILSQDRIKAEELKELEGFLDRFESDAEIEAWLKDSWENLGESSVTLERRKKRNVIKNVAFKLIASAAVIFGVWFAVRYFKIDDNKVSEVASVAYEQELVFKEVVLKRDDGIYKLSEHPVEINDSSVQLKGDATNLKLKSHGLSAVKVQQWSTLQVPVGKDFYVELSDGTKVWMNACSKLKFPDFFIKGKRIVELEGEAYFEVKSDANNPFWVKTPGSKVVVTGTKFNVYHYPEELEHAVTLVEGRVTVEQEENEFVIKPGEQLLSNNAEIKILKVDANKYTSWKDGVFEFNDMTLKDISLRLQKWYNVRFDFEDVLISEERFTGMVKKSSKIEYFVSVLQKTTNLKFEKKENIVFVKKN